jgi:hypothetical protein
MASLASSSGNGIYILLVNLLKAASSRSYGLLVAARTSKFLSLLYAAPFTPSN